MSEYRQLCLNQRKTKLLISYCIKKYCTEQIHNYHWCPLIYVKSPCKYFTYSRLIDRLYVRLLKIHSSTRIFCGLR